jgi:hypothetical protein
LDIPYASAPTKPRDHELRNLWRSAAREHFSPNEISDSRLELLLKGFFKANSSNQLSQLANSWKTYQIYSPSEGQRPTNSGKT